MIAIIIVALILLCSGCELRRAKAAPPPPAPKPVAVPAGPLSIPQTAVQLPPPQPVTAEAIASIPQPMPEKPEEPPPVPEPEPVPKPVRRATPVRPPTPAPAAQAPAPPAEDRPRIQPVLPAGEQRRLAAAIEQRRAEIVGILSKLGARETAEAKTEIDRIESFLTLSRDAAQRGDFMQADALSERALVLARGLRGVQ